jgi:hypothetical protein
MLVALFVSTLVLIFALIALLLPFSFIGGTGKDPPFIFAVVLAGSLGAFFSALIRLYNYEDLPRALVLQELSGLPRTHLVIYSLVPAVVGAIAATVLYTVFAAELLQGGLFPTFRCESERCEYFKSFLDTWHPDQAKDYAKALVWSFIAGFTERLVPNTLESLGRAANNRDGVTAKVQSG